MFVHLHWHSHYTILEGLWTPAKIVEKAKSLGMSSIAITDFCNMFGAVEFYMIAKKNWIKAIIWIEANVQNNLSHVNGKEIQNNIVLLAKDEAWYKNLMKLTSVANTYGYIELPTIDFELLRNNSEWLVCLLWWEESQIWKMILNNEDDKKIADMIDLYIDIFGRENVYIEIIAQDYLKKINIRRINDKLIALAQEKKLNKIVSNVYIYINKDDKKAFETLTNIKDNTIYGSTKIEIGWDRHILSEDELRQVLTKNKFSEKDIDLLIQSNNELSDKLNFKITLWEIYFPDYRSPQQIQDLYEKYKDVLVSD